MKAMTTLCRIREHQPCADGWEKLLRELGKIKADDEQLTLAMVLDSNGFADALWCLRASDVPLTRVAEFAARCAQHVEHQTGVSAETATYWAVKAKMAAAYLAKEAEEAAAETAAYLAEEAAVAVLEAESESEAAYFAERDWQRTLFVEMFCSEDA
jgi:hypothetical protein